MRYSCIIWLTISHNVNILHVQTVWSVEDLMAEKKAKDVRIKEILEAATICFSNKGYSGTSINDICKKAGIAKGGLYWHFKSKREILIALLDTLCSNQNEQWRLLSTVEVTKESLLEVGWSFIENNLKNSDKVRLISVLESEARNDEELMKIYTGTQQFVRDELRAFSRRLKSEYSSIEMEVDVLADYLNIIVSSLVREQITSPLDVDIYAIWEAAVNSLIK